MERIRELLGINRLIASTLDYAEVLHLVVARTAAFTGAPVCVLLLRDADRRARIAASTGLDPDRVLAFDAPLDEQVHLVLQERLGFPQQGTFHAAPIIQGEQLKGILAIFGHAEGDEAMVELLVGALADQAAIALQNSERLRRLEEAAREARAAETTFRELMEASPDPMVIVDHEGAIFWVNTLAETVFGYEHDELLGRPLACLIPERFRALHTVHHSTYFSEPRRRPMGTGLDLSARRKDGSEFPVEISLGPLDSAHGLLVCSAIRDVTSRREAELERQRLLDSERRKSQQLILAIREAHHRIKNNLQAISDLLSLELGASGQASADEVLRDSMERVQTIALVHDLLSQDQDVERVDARSIAERLVPMVLRGSVPAGTLLDLSVRVPSWELTSKQGTTLALIMTELLSNSAKHAFAGRPRGRLEVALELDGPEAVLTVQDDGPGLPPGFSIGTHAHVGLQVVEALAASDLRGGLRLTGERGVKAEVRFPWTSPGVQAQAVTNARKSGA